MDAAQIRARLEEATRPYPVPDWELEERAEALGELPEDAQRRVLELVPAIWPVSHALTFSFLRNAALGIRIFGDTRLQIWVGAILDAYEFGGLDAAGPLVTDGGAGFLRELRGEEGARLRDHASLLRTYASGLVGRALEIAEGREAATDTEILWLPRRIAVFADAPRNLLLYKLAVSVQCAHITLDTYRAELAPGHPLLTRLHEQRAAASAPGPSWLEDYFALFPDPSLAGRAYLAAATARAAADIRTRLPGLWREAAPVVAACFATRPAPESLPARERLFEQLRRWTWLGEALPPVLTAPVCGLLEPLRRAASPPASAVLAAAGLYPIAEELPGGEPSDAPPPFEGQLRAAAAAERRLARRAEARELFIEAFRALVAPGRPEPPAPAAAPEAEFDEAGVAPAADGTVLARPDTPGAVESERAAPVFLRIGAQLVEIPESARSLVAEIRRDLGSIPENYISGVIAAAGNARGNFPGPDVPDGPSAVEAFLYDEWDFRRAGFRRAWCSLRELDLPPGDPGAVARALVRYRGPLLRIRRAFERMRTAERFARRQRDGDEIDIDAVIEARSDLAAGRPATDRIFVRLVRDTRDIAAVFLVDLSSSTEGWVSAALRDSLVLLCEGLEALGDRYAVYGFSGMKRLGAQLFRVKRFEEPYGPAVKGRIGAIGPRDYTRMGPPIRHAAALLRASDARVRLLFLLSDGRPEDYDEYKGDYAIEDTRHALIEARTLGIHPFCITVDREARDYAAHLFGEVSYVVIDDPGQLPLRIPEIYRALTA